MEQIILDLLGRVAKVENDIAMLKDGTALSEEPFDRKGFTPEIPINSRDTSKYLLDGKLYGKGRLVLAVVQKFVEEHPEGITAEKLMSTFDKSLQGSLGVIRTLDDARRSYANYEQRFFTADGEPIHTDSDVCVVCSQWGIFNINRLITRARQLGVDVTVISENDAIYPLSLSDSEEIMSDQTCPIDTRRRPQESFQDFVKRTLEFMFNNSWLQPKELERLQTREYSKKTFGIEFPLLERNSLNIMDAKGHPRYWTGHQFGGMYFACSQWWKQKMSIYEPRFESWIKRTAATHRLSKTAE
jgi:hypothetical protein